MISLIVARSKNNVIGKNGQIPWKIKGEQKQFRELTTGNVVIMGRKSYEEIGHPLPNRMNIVVSTMVGKDNVTFFEGSTNESGIIDNIALPAPKTNPNDLDVPNKITYDITATYGNKKLLYKVDIYENIIVIQNINVIPDSQVGGY